MELRPPKASDPGVFSEKGHAYMDQRLYREAIICFQRAGDNRGLNMAQAWYYCGKGRSARGLGDHNEFLRCYQEAVDRFRKEQQFTLVAQCLEEMNRFEEAGGNSIQSEIHSRTFTNPHQINTYSLIGMTMQLMYLLWVGSRREHQIFTIPSASTTRRRIHFCGRSVLTTLHSIW